MASGVIGSVKDEHAATNPLGGLSTGIGVGYRAKYDRALPRPYPFDHATEALLHRPGLPVGRIKIVEQAVSFPGLLSAVVQTPDNASMDAGLEKITLTVDAALINWTSGIQVLMGQWDSTGPPFTDRSFILYLNAGQMVFQTSPDGLTDGVIFSTPAPVPFGAGVRGLVRVEWERDRGDGNKQAAFFHAMPGGPWVSMGVGVAPTEAIFDSSRPLLIGLAQDVAFPVAGKIYRAEWRSGSVPVALFDPSEAVPGASSWRSSTGEVWTLAGGAGGAQVLPSEDLQFWKASAPVADGAAFPDNALLFNRSGMALAVNEAVWGVGGP